ncbi:uncharacterized protein [Anabrus simplex]|uniref:uncharacterized protein isoform X2 n=1 Tax=Anabrus simplex TaxID=316456 RepID=UPI0035A3B018
MQIILDVRSLVMLKTVVSPPSSGTYYIKFARKWKILLFVMKVQSTSSHSNSKQKDLNYILWLAGKLKLNMREIAEADQERIRLTAQVHKDSLNSCGLPHLSVADTRLVHDTQLLSSSLDRLKKDAELFHTHKYWRKKNHVFWKWMETVLVKKEESKKSIKIDGEQKQELIRFLNVLCRKLNLFLHSANTKTEDTNAASSEESTIQPVLEFQNKSSASYPGVPRFLRVQKKGKETTEVERWLQSSELLLQNLEKECRGRESEINCELDKIAEKMKHIIVLPKSRRSKSPRHPHVF